MFSGPAFSALRFSPSPSQGRFTTDKGYHAVTELPQLQHESIRMVISDPVKKRKLEKLSPEEARAVRSARRSVRSESGKQLLRQRGMHLERSFAHLLDAGGVRRTTWSGLAGWIKNKAAAFFRTPFFGLRKTYFSTGC